MEKWYLRKLEIIKDSIKRLEEIAEEHPTFSSYSSSWRSKDIVERNLQKVIEAFIDIGKVIISLRGLREPANNREVFIILAENRLFPPEKIELILKMVGMRNILVHSYDRIDDSITYGVIKRHLEDLKSIERFFEDIL
jgi:uncharacterized protein YutE (UPF0331/DUF86 family)